jgi:hypothetical protein
VDGKGRGHGYPLTDATDIILVVVVFRRRTPQRRIQLTNSGPTITRNINVGTTNGSEDSNITSEKPNIINLSSYKLEDSETRLLSKGLKFTPTPVTNTMDLEKDIQNFGRKLRLLEFFDEDNTQESDVNLVRNKSKFTPPRNRDTNLDMCVDYLTRMGENLKGQQTKHNMSNLNKQERDALKSLQGNKGIIIKEADKGGAIVIMNTEFYAKKMSEMLQDPETYTLIDGDFMKKTVQMINSLIRTYPNCLTDKEIDYVKNFKMKISNLYGLPKIHKSQLIKKAIEEQRSSCVYVLNPEDLTFRPIIAGPASPTSHLSQLIDKVIKVLPPHTESYIKDTTDFLNKLPKSLDTEKDYIAVSFDVKSLYTSITHDLGLKALEFWISTHRDKIPARFESDFIIEAMKIILTCNDFNFNGNNYLQIKGTAMGTMCAPAYANLTMAYIENKLYEKTTETLGQEVGVYVKNNWKRFLDDCFILWCFSLILLGTFLDLLNGLDENIDFTMESDKHKLSMLDTMVILENGRIKTDIFYKPTDTHQYLPFSSSHPRHTKSNIPFAQARRICLIVTDMETRDKQLDTLKTNLLSQGYPENIILHGINQAKSIPQETLRLGTARNDDNDILPLVITHNPNNPQINTSITAALAIAKGSEIMRDKLERKKLIISRRQPKNLKNILTSARFDTSTDMSPAGTKKCGNKRCGTCPHMMEANNIKINDKDFIIKRHMTCTMENVIYCITCEGCGFQYIGQTNNLRKRVTLHNQHIREPNLRTLYVSSHLANCPQDKTVQYKIIPILYKEDEATRKVVEVNLIRTFKPQLNRSWRH